MKKHTVIVTALAVATFGWISIAAAQPPEGGPRRGQGGPGGPGFGPGGGPPAEMIAERLGLTDDQKAQWKAIHERARAAGEPLMKAEGAAHHAFDKALEADNPDPAAIGQAALAMRNTRRTADAQRKATLEEAKAILTPEQAAKLDEMEKHMRRGGPGGPGGPDGQGPRRRPGQSSK